MAGFFVPVKTVVPPLAFTMVSLDAIESFASASGVVMAVDERVIVAEVPLCVAVSVAAPPPNSPQLALIVAVVGVTAAAVGANASPVTARAPTSTAAPVVVRLPLMGVSSLLLSGNAM